MADALTYRSNGSKRPMRRLGIYMSMVDRSILPELLLPNPFFNQPQSTYLREIVSAFPRIEYMLTYVQTVFTIILNELYFKTAIKSFN